MVSFYFHATHLITWDPHTYFLLLSSNTPTSKYRPIAGCASRASAHTLVNFAQDLTVRLCFNCPLSERPWRLCLSDFPMVGVLASRWLILSTIGARLTCCSSLHSVCLHISMAISYFQFWTLLRQPPTSYLLCSLHI